MSEFMEKHSVARLIGAPPGYVGYEEGGHLTEAVRRKPYSVILLDEVEKAHPDVFNVLLQVLDDGRMTDGQGRTVDFKNTVIVMTSNLGSQMIQQMAGDDYGVIKLAVMAEVKTHFRPEFVNRIDEIVVFHALSEQEHRVDRRDPAEGARSAARQARDPAVGVRRRAEARVAKAGFDPVYGARPLKRAIQQQIENPLAKEILAGKYAAGRYDQGRRGAAARSRSPRADRRASRGQRARRRAGQPGRPWRSPRSPGFRLRLNAGLRGHHERAAPTCARCRRRHRLRASCAHRSRRAPAGRCAGAASSM